MTTDEDTRIREAAHAILHADGGCMDLDYRRVFFHSTVCDRVVALIASERAAAARGAWWEARGMALTRGGFHADHSRSERAMEARAIALICEARAAETKERKL